MSPAQRMHIPDIGMMVRVFANGPGDLGSIPGRVIPKTKKMVLDASLLNTQHYKYVSRVKWSNPGKGVTPSPTPRCSSYRKGSLRVTLDYSRHLYLLMFQMTAIALVSVINHYYINGLYSFKLFLLRIVNHIYQPLHSGRIWHKVNF